MSELDVLKYQILRQWMLAHPDMRVWEWFETQEQLDTTLEAVIALEQEPTP